MGSSHHIYFSGPYRHQNWSFKNSYIDYILKHPSSVKVWRKMVQSCKYFFAKNSIVAFEQLFCRNEKWRVYLRNQTLKDIRYTSNPLKFWITANIELANCSVPPLISRIYKLNARFSDFSEQMLSYNEFLYFSANVAYLGFYNTIVKNDDGSIVPFEKLVEGLPKLKEAVL
uniref:Maturase K n=1 Tax=Panagrolaimus davidi TaxID=227884 RepID=A0A914PZV4_9BILA